MKTLPLLRSSRPSNYREERHTTISIESSGNTFVVSSGTTIHLAFCSTILQTITMTLEQASNGTASSLLGRQIA